MKLLYAIQCTGNGHLTRAQEIIPVLEKYAQVDLLFSGHQSQIRLEKQPKFRFKGISLHYNNTGGLSYFKTMVKNNYCQTNKDIKNLDLREYDMVINDFEPISAYACKKQKKEMISISHQAALTFDKTPKPKFRNAIGEWVLNNYAPYGRKVGFHFDEYDNGIYSPVIRSKIRNLKPVNLLHYVVYLPGYDDKTLIQTLSRIAVKWKVFSKHATTIKKYHNIDIYPVNDDLFVKYLESCEGVLCNAGFETPSETLFLNKKLFVIPIKGQYEQVCNAFALKQMGVATSNNLDVSMLKKWINSDTEIKVDYPDHVDDIIRKEIIS